MHGCFTFKKLTSTLSTHKKKLWRIVNKDHETSFNGVLTIKQQFKVFNNKIFRNLCQNC